MQQKVHLLNVNYIGQNMGEEIYSNTLFNRLWHYQCANVLVQQQGCSYQTDREPLPHKVINILSRVGKHSKNIALGTHQWHEALTCVINVNVNKLQYKKVPKPYTYTDFFKWHEHELTSALLYYP